MVFAFLACVAGSAIHAHTTGASHLRIDAPATGLLAATWDIPAIDLRWALDLDADGDARISAREIQTHRAAIARLAIGRLGISRGGVACSMAVGSMASGSRASEPSVSLRLSGRCLQAGALEVSTGLFFGSPTYSALLDVRTAEGRHQAILSPTRATWLQSPASSGAETFARFLVEGVRHVLIGYDHIAFLLLLLLPGLLRGARADATAATGRREAARDLVKIITAFTLAHSVTLGLAATDTLRMPARPVEIAIAGSIVVAGLMNLFPATTRWRLPLAFGFGLVHGFGFANALSEIDIAGSRLAPLLAGFNLGVELAQLSIVAVALAALLALGRSPFYFRRLVPALSFVTATVGALWLASRIG